MSSLLIYFVENDKNKEKLLNKSVFKLLTDPVFHLNQENCFSEGILLPGMTWVIHTGSSHHSAYFNYATGSTYNTKLVPWQVA